MVCFVISGLITLMFFSNLFQASELGFKTQSINLSTVKEVKAEQAEDSTNASRDEIYAKYKNDGVHISKNGADVEFTKHKFKHSKRSKS